MTKSVKEFVFNQIACYFSVTRMMGKKQRILIDKVVLNEMNIFICMLNTTWGANLETMLLSYLKDYLALRWNLGETIHPEDLVQLLRDIRGILPTTNEELGNMKRTFVQFLKITKPQ